jgi:hypothetical protein
MKRPLWCALMVGLLVSIGGCGGGGNGGASLPVGSDQSPGPGGFLDLDADTTGSTATLDAYFTEKKVRVTFVTLQCAGDCADVQAVGTGGNPPYTYTWDDGSTSSIRHICPSSNKSYSVKVTDKGTSGEFPQPPATATVPLEAYVLSCADAGAPAGCDSVTKVSATGANPNGPWSYGWSMSLGGTFTRQTEFLTSPSGYGGINVWTSGTPGVQLNPSACVNPTAGVITLTTITIQPGQFFMHPGPIGQYSITRWTASRAGTYTVKSVFEGIDNGPTTTDVHVQHNGVDVATGSINIGGGSNAFSSNPSVTVAAGDTIDFAVGFGNYNYNNDSTALSATVCSGSAAPDGG